MFGYFVLLGATPPSVLIAPSDCSQQGPRIDSVAGKGNLLLLVLS